jgi:cytochrome c oxidase assembly factor 5
LKWLVAGTRYIMNLSLSLSLSLSLKASLFVREMGMMMMTV